MRYSLLCCNSRLSNISLLAFSFFLCAFRFLLFGSGLGGLGARGVRRVQPGPHLAAGAARRGAGAAPGPGALRAAAAGAGRHGLGGRHRGDGRRAVPKGKRRRDVLVGFLQATQLLKSRIQPFSRLTLPGERKLRAAKGRPKAGEREVVRNFFVLSKPTSMQDIHQIHLCARCSVSP